jgi:YD repeat-containing protein
MFKNVFSKSLLSAVLTASILVGCNKDDDPKTKQCLLTSFVNTFDDGSFTRDLTYDGQKVTKITETYTEPGSDPEIETSTFTYDSKGNVTESTSENSRTVYTYTNDQITKVENFYRTILSDRTDYEYSNNQLTKVQYYHMSSGTPVKDSYEIFEYSSTSSANPIRVKSFNSSSTTASITAEYTYDDKKKALAALPAAFLKLIILDGQGTANNVTKLTGTEGTTVTTVTYTYEYNTEGYPTKSTGVETSTGQTKPETSATVYTYNCN